MSEPSSKLKEKIMKNFYQFILRRVKESPERKDYLEILKLLKK